MNVIHLNKLQKERQEQFKEITKDNGKASCCSLAKLRTLKKNKDKPTTNKKSDKRVFVLDFDGDIKASGVKHFREEISNIISIAKAGDEVVVRLESGGGQVNGYGLAAAQLVRLKQAGLLLTVCVDKIAASGGYMMACVANKVLASDFAVIGSVGVVSQLPNFHEFLKKHHIGFEMFTAGEYKRTVTMFGENDDKDRAKYQEELDRIHELFQAFIKTHRPALDVEKIATGEFWFGADALALGLVDEICTSDSYLLSLLDEHDVFVLALHNKPTLAEKLGLNEHLGHGVKALIESAEKTLLTAFRTNTPLS